MDTKACSLTENEIHMLIASHARNMASGEHEISEFVERVSYLNKRLKAFNEPDKADNSNASMTDTQVDAINQAAASNPAPKGW